MNKSYSLDQLAEKGNQIYLEKLANKLEPTHNGEYVVIEVDSGDYYRDKDVLNAINKAQKKHPNKLFHIIQIGSISRVSSSKKVFDSAWLF